MSGAASLLDATDLNPTEESAVRRFGLVGKAAEVAAMARMEDELARVERVALPLR